jgi:quercetin dioxygenase-like cupin family protein
MRMKWLLPAAAAALAIGVSGAVANHVTEIDPTTVPVGFLAAHNDVANMRINSFARVIKRHRADVFIQHFQFGPNAATGWHTHPGPAIVTVVRGSFSYQDAHGKKRCRTKTYTAGHGFFDPGFGHVHRGIAGASGAHLYVVFLVPSGAPTQTIPKSPPAACS